MWGPLGVGSLFEKFEDLVSPDRSRCPQKKALHRGLLVLTPPKHIQPPIRPTFDQSSLEAGLQPSNTRDED